ncbi:MAG: hypothetical protein PHI86_07425 [Candidatus Omnitrophica bacterium]|nr:hypothetical protein [Candidatus Omnitrophota bacterium]
MNDKVSFVPDSVKEAVENTASSAKNEFKKGIKETFNQILGINPKETQKNQEEAKKIAEKAEKSGHTIEEQAKLESLRKQLHQQVIAPRPKAPEQPVSEQEDKVGTNEQMQQLGDNPTQSANTLPPLAQPSLRHGERLKIRE